MYLQKLTNLFKQTTIKQLLLSVVLFTITSSIAQVSNVGTKKMAMNVNGSTLKIPYYSNFDLSSTNNAITRAIVVVHGLSRDADNYYATMMTAASMRSVNMDSMLVIAPQFLTEEDIEEHNLDNEHLYWTEGGWASGSNSRNESAHPRPERIPSYAVLDTILLRLAKNYPNLQSIVFTGHSAGGQTTNRYSATTPLVNILCQQYHVSIKFIVANAGTYLYMDNKRKVAGTVNQFQIPATACSTYNDWKYGLGNLYTYPSAAGADSIRSMFKKRQVVYLLGEDDNDPNSSTLDIECEAMLQGNHRLERGTVYFNYLKNYYGADLLNYQTVDTVPNADHSSSDIYTSAIGLFHLFETPPRSCCVSCAWVSTAGAMDRAGWITTASSNTTLAQKGLDSNAATRWNTQGSQANGQWYTVDMKTVNTINKIVLDATGSPYDSPMGYSVFVSNNGTSWGSAVATGAGTNGMTLITFTNQTGRYIRIVQTGNKSNNWSIHELYVFGKVNVASISVTPASATLNVNATQQLTATILPANATNKNITWSSSNATIATVSATGLVTAKAAGTTTITATSQDGNKTAISAITVKAIAPVITSAATASGKVGTAFSYTITASNTPTSYAATGLPANVSVNVTSGLISGTPAVAGTYNATVSAINAGGSGSKAVVITIAPSTTNTSVNEPFETGLPSSAPGVATNYTLTSGVWVLFKGSSNSTAHGGSKALKLDGGNATNPTYAAAPAVNKVSTVSFWAKASSNTTYSIQKSVNGGAYTTVATQAVTTTYKQYTITVNEINNNVRIRFANTTGQTHYIDDVSIGSNAARQGSSESSVIERNKATDKARPKNINILLSPNPVTMGEFSVSIPAYKGPVTWEIRNLQGVLLLKNKTSAESEKFTVPIHGLTSGVYVIHLQLENKRFSKKIMVE